MPAVYAAFLSIFVVSLILSLFLVPIASRLAVKVGLVDNPGKRKIHEHAIPYGGGIAIVLAFTITVLAVCYLAYTGIAKNLFPEIYSNLGDYISAISFTGNIRKFAAMILGGAIIFCLGFFDDKFMLKAKTKLFVQIIAACLAFWGGVRITAFIGNEWINFLFTCVWIVGITNAMNFLDNMDGLSAGVGFIASFIFMIYAAQGGNLVVCGLLCALMGAILGFLPYNFSPAKVFMGDAGSLFLGYMLAVVSVCGTYYSESQSMLSIVVPVIVLAIPVFDTCSVMAIRLKNKKPLMEGDKNHFSHRLVKLGMTKREAVLSIYILCLTTGIVALMLRSLNDAESVLILFHIFGVFVFIALLEIASRRDNNNGN